MSKVILTDDYDRVMYTCNEMDNHNSGDPPLPAEYYKPADDLEKANLISSRTIIGTHRPVLDIDFPARLLPSKSKGHFHLYLDGLELSPKEYFFLLKQLKKMRVIQNGFFQQFHRHKATMVRKPK